MSTTRIAPSRFLAGLLLAGLLTGVTGCLNPDLVNATSGGLYPTAPGDTPFVLVRVVNDTGATIDALVTTDIGTFPNPSYSLRNLDPYNGEAGVLLPWPVLRLGLGNLDDPFDTNAITATLESGLTINVPVAFPALVAGRDFNRGDTVVFQLTEAPQSPSSIRVNPVLISGQGQEGPFSRSDTFEKVRLLLLLNGLLELQGSAPQ